MISPTSFGERRPTHRQELRPDRTPPKHQEAAGPEDRPNVALPAPLVQRAGHGYPRRLRDRHDPRQRHKRQRAGRVAPLQQYEATSLSRTEPWKAENISRRTWERRRAASACAVSTSLVVNGLAPKGESRTGAPLLKGGAAAASTSSGREPNNQKSAGWRDQRTDLRQPDQSTDLSKPAASEGPRRSAEVWNAVDESEWQAYRKESRCRKTSKSF
jgi:hypothetical protein